MLYVVRSTVVCSRIQKSEITGCLFCHHPQPELFTGRVGSGRVTILPDFGGSGQVSTSEILVFTDYFLVPINQGESSNTAFGLMVFLRYLIYIIIKQLINNFLF